MWPRIIEVALACWLALSPFIFGYDPRPATWWAVDFVVASLVMLCSLISFWYPARRAYVGTLALGLGLAAYGYFAGGHPSPPPMQNHLIVGLLLAMMAILPSHSEHPPHGWARFYAQRRDLDQT